MPRSGASTRLGLIARFWGGWVRRSLALMLVTRPRCGSSDVEAEPIPWPTGRLRGHPVGQVLCLTSGLVCEGPRE